MANRRGIFGKVAHIEENYLSVRVQFVPLAGENAFFAASVLRRKERNAIIAPYFVEKTGKE